jgi:demethylmenaquinone methyltransferase/2-methoxy-6-polyprenyl-1,4-benzoquinol methylase
MTRTKPLYHIFTNVADRYDLINRIVTLGLDQRWRLAAARQCLAPRPQNVLDLCCGTGDLTIHLARLACGSASVTALDYSLPMLEVAVRKARRAALAGQISFVHSNAADLPFSDGQFDCVGISFAFRNLTYRNPLTGRYLSEILRVLKSGGRVIAVESSQPDCKLVRRIFHMYARCFVYLAGRLLSGSRGAYRYMADSIIRFHDDQQVRKLLLTAGFHRVSSRRLLLGAVRIHTALKR